MPRDLKGFSILEVIIVTIIIGVLAALGLASFAGPKEQVLDKEAQANLKLIASAEKILRMEMNSYRNCADTLAVNDDLRLMIPRNSPSWNYKVDSATASAFTAKAQRTSGPNAGRTFCINAIQDNATTGVGCNW